MSNFHNRNEFDLNPLPSMEALRAGDGRLLKVSVLKEMASTWEGYNNEYLQTIHWQGVRERTFLIHGRRCRISVDCDGPLNVHHVHYKTLGEEKPENGDTDVLCDRHHKMAHEAERAFVREQGCRQFNQP